MKVIALRNVHFTAPDGQQLIVSPSEFKKNPEKVYEVDDNGYWNKMVHKGGFLQKVDEKTGAKTSKTGAGE